MKDKIGSFFKKRKIIYLYKSIIRKVTYSGSPYFRYLSGDKIILFVMICLQFISFCTTLNGAKYYFGDLFPSAPLVFTVGIQIAFLWFGHIYAKIKHRKKSNGFFLILFALISMSFSYTGLVMTSFPPEEEYTTTFKEYVSKADSVRNLIVKEESDIESIEQDALLFIPEVNSLIKSATVEIHSLEEGINEWQAIYDSDNTVDRQYDENGNLISIYQTKGDAATEVSSQIGEQTRRISELKQLKKNLKQNAAKVTAEEVRRYVTASEEDNTFIELETDISQIITSFNNLAKRLENVESLDKNYIFDLREKYLYFDDIRNVNEKLYKEDTYDKNDISTFWERIFNNDSSATKAVEKLNSLRDIVNENYLELSSIVTNLELDSSMLNGLSQTKAELDNYGDPNFQAVVYLLDDDYRNKILGIALMALLVDGLTFLLGFLGNNTSFSVLYSNSNREIESEDQLFSIIFLSLVSEQVPKNLNQGTVEAFEMEFYQYIESIRKLIRDFINKFEIYPYLTQFGYCLRVNKSEIEKEKDMIPIISILLQLQYMTYVNQEELEILEKYYRNEDLDNYKISVANGSNGYYFLRYRMEAYLRYSLAETTIDSIDFGVSLQRED